MNAKEFIKYAAVFAAGAYTQQKYTHNQVFRDTRFLVLFDTALQNVTQEEIDQLIYLEPDQLKDWVMAPSPLRSKLLQKFAEQKQQLAYETLQAEEDNTLIKAYDDAFSRQKNKLLKLVLTIGLISLISLFYGVTKHECTSIAPLDPLKRLYASENELKEDKLKHDADEMKIRNNGGLVCGDEPPPPTLTDDIISAVGIVGILSFFAAFIIFVYEPTPPENVQNAKKRRNGRLFGAVANSVSSLFGGKQ
jgi:hypothetical protein